MNQKKSFFSRAIILNDLRLNYWIAILYFIALVLFGPMTLALGHYDSYLAKQYFDINNAMKFIFLMIFPILTATHLFRFLQSDNSVAGIHSQPFTRKQQLNSHMISGLILTLVPVIVADTISYFLIMANSPEVMTTSIVYHFGFMVLMTLAMFTCAMMVNTLSGLSISSIIITYILLVLPYGLMFMIYGILQEMLYGFVYSGSVENTIALFSPLTVYFKNNTYDSMFFLVVLGLLSIVYYTIGYVSYKHRPLENTKTIVSLDVYKPLFKYGVAFCASLTIGIYLNYTFRSDSSFYTVINYLIGGAIGYFIAEMLLQKKLRVLKSSFKGFITFSLVMGLLFSILYFDAFGFESRVPDPSKVQSVSVKNASGHYYGNYPDYSHDKDVFTNSETIQLITEFHTAVVNDDGLKDAVEQDVYYYRGNNQTSFEFIYTMNNGSKMIRQYYLDVKAYEGYLKPLYETEDYKYYNYPLIGMTVEDIASINLNGNSYNDKYDDGTVTLSSKAQMNGFLTALESDILAQPFESMTYYNATIGWIEYYTYDEDGSSIRAGNIPLLREYTHTIQWLKDNGYKDHLVLDANNIDYAVVERNFMYYDEKGIDYYNDADIQKVKITDPVQIKELFDNRSTAWDYEDAESLSVSFTIMEDENSLTFTSYLPVEKIPAFMDGQL